MQASPRCHRRIQVQASREQRHVIPRPQQDPALSDPGRRSGYVPRPGPPQHKPSAKRVNEYMAELSAVIFQVAGGKCAIVVETRSEEPRVPKAQVVEEVAEEEFIDIEEIKQLPTVSNKATETNLADAFPGSEILTEDE